MNSDGFYAAIEPFDDFAGVADPDHYRVAPDDWHVVITDVEGSTRAIAEGRYKEVNMIGAACINAVLNITPRGEVPFVFGGDGATLLVPTARLDDCLRVLLGVRRLAETDFDLSLRVGAVAVAELHARSSARVLVGKYRLSPGNELAAFSGGGIEQAERWIKADPGYLAEPGSDQLEPDLSGLSCRWEPLAAQNGIMLSLLLQARVEGERERARLYRELIGEIDRITGSLDSNARPVRDANMVFRWPPRGLSAEIRALAGGRKRLRVAAGLYLNSLIQYFLDRFDLTAGGYRGRSYRVELRSNTDYRRFDDTLRMLLDCSLEQADEIETLLAARAQAGELAFGVHRSDSALMTCLVFSLDRGEHVHFVDGSDGGFTNASRGFKAARE